ncbi:MAG: hypothetical protein DRG80_06550 [Deltaproteobacteria bacterium]|nr:MAG: hypothetical protein DRG80_06550 [Deltaproteobacteria bacterium]
MRLLILLAIIYLCYRALKSWMLQSRSTQKTVFDKTAGEMDDVMIKDPFCKIYFPKKDSVHLRIDGKDLYFCSTECRDKFEETYSKK